MKSGLARGLALLLVGAFVIYWAVSHSPKAGVGQIIGNELSGSYTMSSGAYWASLIAGIVLALLGALRVFKSMK